MVWPVQDDCPGAGRHFRDYEGKLKVCKLNIDENTDTPPKYAYVVLTLTLFRTAMSRRPCGALSKSQLAAFLDSNI